MQGSERKTFAVVLFLVPDLRAGDVSAQLDKLNAMGLTGLPSSRSQVAEPNHQRQSDCNYCNGQKKQRNIYNGLTIVASTGKTIFMVA